jgi:hypothetical protein
MVYLLCYQSTSRYVPLIFGTQLWGISREISNVCSNAYRNVFNETAQAFVSMNIYFSVSHEKYKLLRVV